MIWIQFDEIVFILIAALRTIDPPFTGSTTDCIPFVPEILDATAVLACEDVILGFLSGDENLKHREEIIRQRRDPALTVLRLSRIQIDRSINQGDLFAFEC
jgi:hypothetical protein